MTGPLATSGTLQCLVSKVMQCGLKETARLKLAGKLSGMQSGKLIFGQGILSKNNT
jgi:hypothetical protein